MILGIALDIRWQDFRAVAAYPKALIAGISAQFLILPAATLLLTLLVDLPAGVELGMILVAACPGGALSNFVTHLSGGNTALSISMTAVASVLAVFLLPLNFMFWASLNADASLLLKSIQVSATELFITLFSVLAVPLALGLWLKQRYVDLAKKLHQLLKVTSLLALAGFVFVAIANNQKAFLAHFQLIFTVVFSHNAMAFFLGYLASKLARLNSRDLRATTIEVGMQNSSLAIAIVFSQFGAEAGMALVSAFWGTWHIISGLTVALLFRSLSTIEESR